MKKSLSLVLLMLIALCAVERGMADSGPQYYRTAVHNGNRVKTVFGNWGVIGQPIDTRPRGAWIYSSNGYIGDVSLFVGAEVKLKNGTPNKNVVFHSVVTCPVSRPSTNRDESLTGEPWTFMPVSGFFNANKNSIAMSDDQTTWPGAWPDKMNDPNDPGWRGWWNGYFGKRASANQESYFVMDDNNDKRFNFATNNTINNTGIAFKPDSTNPSRNGLALEVRVRGMQWAQFLAQDNIFWLYDITNTGTTTYDRSVFGMLVGTLVGVTGSQLFNEYDDDWSFYDVNENITYTGDYGRNMARNPFWVGPVGMVGYAFLESPGNPYDGIDNDGDAEHSSIGATAPLFTAADFDSVTIKAGDKLVVINDDFSRTVITMPNKDTTIMTRGANEPIAISPGKTKLSEGGVVIVNGIEAVNSNAYDGVDNDLDGIIDENFYLHFRQIKKSDDVPPKTLIDILRPVRHRTYTANPTGDGYAMIDERRDDLIDNDRDWDINFDDVGRDGVRDSKNPDFGEGDGMPTSGYLANGFDTGLPGEPHIDKTDVDESDQIGLTSFQYFTPSNDVPLGQDELLWNRLRPGFFSVPKSIVANKPERGEDGDFIYGSAYFPLIAKKTERFSMALVYGGGVGGSVDDDIQDLLKHKRTVQKIYDANYQFPIPPDPAPTLSAIAGDKQVKLYWDRKSEDAIDPVLRIKDFQGYKIYKATDREFNDAFNVTDANGVKKGYQAAFQVDKADSVSGFFRAPADVFQQAEGFTYQLGKNTGLVHDTTDYDVINGRTYYYVIVAYDNGDEKTGIFPSENSWKIDLDQAGRITGYSQNVAIVVPGRKALGYQSPAGSKQIAPVSTIATGSLGYKVVDESKITGNGYKVVFYDTRDSGKLAATTTLYSVQDSMTYEGTFTPNRVDTIQSPLPRTALVPGSVTVMTSGGTVIPASDYTINYERGTIRASRRFTLQPDTVNLRKLRVTYQYYPVYKSPFINGSPFTSETKDTDIFDGLQLVFQNDWDIVQRDARLNNTRTYNATLSTIPIELNGDNTPEAYAMQYPADYDVIISDTYIDSTAEFIGLTPQPVKYKIINRTENKPVKSLFGDNDMNDRINYGDQLYLIQYDSKNHPFYTWVIDFNDTLGALKGGDTVHITTHKPFRSGDVYSFSTQKPFVNEVKKDSLINTIRVVPNPYVVASSREQPLTPGTFGRGERRIEFQNVPSDAKISIYTARGELVRRLQADGSIANGVVAWDVKSSENLDIAYGVYFYVVESSGGTKTGKIAIIK
ncbi:MAG: hypothetical protein ACM3Q4_00860 [Acidobacteriota bacterium]